MENLFRLDGTPTVYVGSDALPSMSPSDKVNNVVFAQGQWEIVGRRVKKVKFTNVAFSKILLSKITFTDCEFEDCLFIGTQFDSVEFHGCSFVDCNFWKSQFRQVFIDPMAIKFSKRFAVEASNVGISVFQALLENFAVERQDEFYMKADVLFRRWKRYQISADVRRKRITRIKAVRLWITSMTLDLVAKYGYSPARFFITTLILFFAVSIINYFCIGASIQVNNAPLSQASFIDTVFYTFSILTVLGFSSIVPSSDFAKSPTRNS